MRLPERLPLIIAVLTGVATLLGLLFLPALSNQLLRWGGFVAAFALLLGVFNLLSVHASRLLRGGNVYSGVLVLGLLSVVGLGLSDGFGLTNGAVEQVFNVVQAPLEAALAALLAFFLLFAGMRLLRRQRNVWGVLFLVAALLALLAATPLPAGLAAIVDPIHSLMDALFVQPGVRGLLIGVALGTITLSLRLLAGSERPYNK